MRNRRRDIQGLRAIAVALVVLYHAGVPGIRGGYVGVDVFFVISGFLITGQLVRAHERTGRLDFLAFYAGRIRRLLPSMALVTVATLVAGALLLDPFSARSLDRDALTASLYVVNYRFAFEGTVYQEIATAPSALQHLWSLAVEEQFYLIWPALITVSALLWRGRPRMALVLALVVVGGVSLGLSIATSASDPSMAYFSLQTRAWEFAVGALVALGEARLSRLPRGAVESLAFAGVAAIVLAAVAFNAGTPFPGSAALLPVLGAAAVIAAGCAEASGDAAKRSSIGRVLSLRPAQWLGDMSYTWYLWHWPLIVLAPDLVHRSLDWQGLTLVCLLALVLAAGTHYLVEQPLRDRPLRIVRVLGPGLVAAMLASVVAVSVALPDLSIGKARTVTAYATAATLPRLQTKGLKIREVPKDVTPVLADAANDVPVATKDGSGCYAQPLQIAQPKCVYGDPTGHPTVVLVGDSHAEQWLPALIQFADEHRIKVVTWTKSACSLADLREYNTTLHREYHECDTWRNITVRRVLKLHPAFVIVSQSDNIPLGYTNEQWSAATKKVMLRFKAAGMKTAYILDTPLAATTLPPCLAEHLDDVPACVRKAGPGMYQFAGRLQNMRMVLSEARIPTVDPRHWLCSAKACPAIVDSIIVYRDYTHLTATFSKFLTPLMAEVFRAANVKP